MPDINRRGFFSAFVPAAALGATTPRSTPEPEMALNHVIPVYPKCYRHAWFEPNASYQKKPNELYTVHCECGWSGVTLRAR